MKKSRTEQNRTEQNRTFFNSLVLRFHDKFVFQQRLLYYVVLSFFMFFTSTSLLESQTTDTINYDSILVKSYIDNNFENVDLQYSILRYKDFVDLLLISTSPKDLSKNLYVEILDYENMSSLKNVALDSNGVTRITGLHKDKQYKLKVYNISDETESKVVNSNLSVITTSQVEELRVSYNFYKLIGEWSSNDNQAQSLSSYLKDNLQNLNSYEVAMFMQNHYNIEEISNSYVSNIDQFIIDVAENQNTVNDSTNNQSDKCRCSLVLNTYRYARKNQEIYSGAPEVTNYLAQTDGAAKRMLLSMNGKHGEGKYEAHIGGVQSPAYAIISYNQVCSDYYTGLPEECMCPKRILYDYSYTTHVTTKVKKGGDGWIWSAGGEAAAEDYALVTTNNGGIFSAIDAGKVRVSTNCNSSWNSDWWTSAAEVLATTTGIILDKSKIVTSLGDLLSQVVKLLSKNFSNKSGDCTNKDEIQTIMAKGGELVMTTNKPVDIIISSLGYEYVKGFGKWESRATLVSDYHLTAVLLGNDFARPECCTPNVADYQIGNFEDEYIVVQPQNVPKKILDGSVNSLSDLKGKVNKLLTLWGPWPLSKDINGHYILNSSSGHIVRIFPGCAPIDPAPVLDTKDWNEKGMDVIMYPNPVVDVATIKHLGLSSVMVFNILGQLIYEVSCNPEQELNELHIGELPPGSHILLSKDTNGNLFYNHFQKF